MPVLDPAAIAGILADLAVNIVSYAGIAALLYAIGGILIRTVSWTFDKLLINFIGSFYKYFEIIINGELLTDSVVKGMMDRVYLLVGVFVVFRLGMLLFNYMLNPSEVMDEKLGVNSLIKRVVLGLILILFMPNIFAFAFRLQEAVLKDQVIERIIMPENHMQKTAEYKGKHGMGKIIGMTVFNGFFSISSSASNDKKVETTYNKAMKIDENYDLSVIDGIGSGLGGGILYESRGEYAFDYFPIFSTVVLGYVLYLLIQYCLDAVVRSFKLSVLQVIAPVCIVEYMVNGDRNEVFKSWRKAVIATFAMLFMRVASIWFVAYITMLMQPNSGIESTSLLQTPDNLLKAIIVLGLLAFMMDFPKMISDVFGLDLDQSGAVKNVMGKAMGAATAGLAIGGAVAGFGMKAAGATKGTLKGGLTNLVGKDSSFAKGLNNPFKTAFGQAGALAGKIPGVGTAFNKIANSPTGIKVASGAKTVSSAFASAAKENNLGTTLKTGAMATGAAILAANSVTKSASGGYQQTTGAVQNKISGQAEKESNAQMQSNISKIAEQQNFQAIVELAARLKIANPTLDAITLPTAVVDAQIAANPQIPKMTANIAASFDAVAGSAGAPVANVNQAQQIVTTELRNAGVSNETIVQVQNDIQRTYASSGSLSSADASRLVEGAYRQEYTPQAERASKLVP